MTEPEENALAIPENANEAAIHADDETFKEVSQSTGFLPYLFICATNSALIAEEKAKGGNVVLKAGQSITDLGKEISGLVLAWRFRAMDYDGDVESCFDPKSEDWTRIKKKADMKGQTGASYGFEFLIYSPKIQPGGFALYLMGNESARREAPNLKAILDEWKNPDHDRKIPAMILKSRYHKGAKFSWYIPVITVCSTPVQPMPEEGDIAAQLANFNNPPKDEREKVEDEKDGGRER